MIGAVGASTLCSGFTWPFGGEEARASLLIAGSSSMQAALEALVAAFSADHGNIDAVVEGGGSTPGLIAVQRGAIEIAALTRQPTRYEETNDTRAFLIAKDALVVAAHPSVTLKTLSYDVVKQVFQGQIRRWSEIGGPDIPVVIVHRSDETSTEYSSAQQMLLEQDDIPDAAQRAGSTAEMRKILGAQPGAIGYFALRDQIEGLTILDIDKVGPDRVTVLSGRYALTRPYYLATYGPLAPAVADFLTFVRGAEGQAILERSGLVRVY
jgi:phosphate transport system substrate-binding protein